MIKPPRICPCNEKVQHGELCTCQQKARNERNQRHDAKRPSAAKRGYNGEWRKARTEYLQAHPYCRACAQNGITRLASVVDHIIPHRGDRNLFWHRANWQPLCEPCHNSHKQSLERKL